MRLSGPCEAGVYLTRNLSPRSDPRERCTKGLLNLWRAHASSIPGSLAFRREYLLVSGSLRATSLDASSQTNASSGLLVVPSNFHLRALVLHLGRSSWTAPPPMTGLLSLKADVWKRICLASTQGALHCPLQYRPQGRADCHQGLGFATSPLGTRPHTQQPGECWPRDRHDALRSHREARKSGPKDFAGCGKSGPSESPNRDMANAQSPVSARVSERRKAPRDET